MLKLIIGKYNGGIRTTLTKEEHEQVILGMLETSGMKVTQVLDVDEETGQVVMEDRKNEIN